MASPSVANKLKQEKSIKKVSMTPAVVPDRGKERKRGLMKKNYENRDEKIWYRIETHDFTSAARAVGGRNVSEAIVSVCNFIHVDKSSQ